MKRKKRSYIIIPGCCDLNRGDQALGWETKRIAQDAGFDGEYSILAERDEPIKQSLSEGYDVLVPVLEHPSRKFSKRDNIIYNRSTKLKWGIVALKDLLRSLLILKSKRYRKYTVKHSEDGNYVKTLKKFQEADAIFMKGGGLIQSHGGLIATYATYYRLYHIFLAIALKKKVYILPNSFGPFDGPFVKWMIKKAFAGCQVITSREKQSQKMVKSELGIVIQNYPDLAFFLENGNITRKQLCDRMNISNDKKIVAITMRPYRFPQYSNPEKKYDEYKKQMRFFISWLNSNGFVPLIVEHTFAITSHESDGDCIRDVISGLNETEYCLLSDRRMNCRDLKSVYGCCDYIIGTRFHSLIFSLSNRVPGIAISYDGYKSTGIMKDMNLEDYVVDISSVTCDNLVTKFKDMICNEEQILKNIDEYILKAKKNRQALIKQLKIGC